MHFLRFWALLFALSILKPAWSQKPDLDINWEFREGAAQQLEVWLNPANRLVLEYHLQDAEILSLRLSEGRLKQELDYSYSEGILKVILPQGTDPRARVYIKYRLPWSVLEASPFVNLLNPGIALNALNMEDQSGSGSVGLIFPGPVSGAKQSIFLGLSADEELNIEIPLELQFELRDDQQLVRYFRSSEKTALNDFYLALGEFRRFDPEDFMADLQEQERAIEDQKLEQFRSQYKGVLAYISREQDRIFTREDLLELSKIEGTNRAPAFPSLNELDLNLEIARIELAILQQYFPNTWTEHWAELQFEKTPSEKWAAILKQHQAAGDSTYLFWDYLLQDYLRKQNLSWEDSSKALSRNDSLYLQKATYFLERRKSQVLQLSYRMKFSEGQMEFYTEHSDTLNPLVFNLKGEAYFKDDTLHFFQLQPLEAQDTLVVKMAESPRAIYLQKEEEGLIELIEQRPLNFLLYDLSQKDRPQLRRQALLELLENSNARLKATVVGIALDSEERELQLLALDKVKELKPEGRARIQSTIEALAAQNEDVKLKQKAAALLSSEP